MKVGETEEVEPTKKERIEYATVLTFMMGVTALSVPSIVMLKQVMKNKLLGIFVGIISAGIIVIGYIFNIFQF